MKATLALLLCIYACTAHAEQKVQKATADEIKADFSKRVIDAEVPSVPAFVALGADPTDATRATSLKDIAMAFGALTSSGKTGAAGGVEFAPIATAMRGKTDFLDDYVGKGGIDNPDKFNLMRVLLNTKLSFATAPNEIAGLADRRAAGVQMVLIDEGDPRLSKDVRECFSAINTKIVLQPPPQEKVSPKGAAGASSTDSKSVVLLPEISKELDDCLAKSAPLLRFRSKAAIGFAIGSGRDKNTNEDRLAGRNYWATYNYGFRMRSQKPEGMQLNDSSLTIAYHGLKQELFESTVGLGANTRRDRDTLAFSLISLMGDASKDYTAGDYNLKGQYAISRVAEDFHPSRYTRSLAIGAEVKTSFFGKDGWLVFSVGSESGLIEGKRQQIGQLTLRYGFSDMPIYK